MGIFQRRRKRKACEKHRQERYEYWLDRLINKQAKPGDVTLRYRKLKQVRGK